MTIPGLGNGRASCAEGDEGCECCAEPSVYDQADGNAALLAALVEVDTYLHGVLCIKHDDVTAAVRATVTNAIKGAA